MYQINASLYDFDATAITSTVETGWLQLPDSDIAIHKIEFRAKGTASSILSFSGYKNLSSSASVTASITLTTTWTKYTLGPKSIFNILRGDCIKLGFSHATATSYSKMKDLVIYAEKIPEQISLSDTAITVV